MKHAQCVSLIVTVFALGLFSSACVLDPESIGMTLSGSSTGESQGSMGSTSEGETATSGSASDTTTEGESMSSTGGATDSTSTSDATTTTDATTTDSTTDGVECDLEMIASDGAELNPSPYVDCGVVSPRESTDEEWQTARLCALDAVADQKGFKLVTWFQGIDSKVGYAYVGFEGESYGLSAFYYDSIMPVVVTERVCSSLTAEASCIADVGSPCLTCVDAGPSGPVCGG